MFVIKIFLTEWDRLYFCFSCLKYFSLGREQRNDKADWNHEENSTKWVTVLIMGNMGSQRGMDLCKRNTAQHCCSFLVLQPHSSHLVIYLPRNWSYFFIAKAASINVYHYLKIQNSVHIAIFKVLTLLVWNSRYFISNSAAHGNIMCKMHLKSRVPGCWFCFSIIYVYLLDLLCGSIQWIITDIFKQIGERPESVLAV